MYVCYLYMIILCYNFSLLVLVFTCLCMLRCMGKEGIIFVPNVGRVVCDGGAVILMYFNYVCMFYYKIKYGVV
jgi:hypothetical protein